METAIPRWAKSRAFLPRKTSRQVKGGQNASSHGCTWISGFVAGRSCTQIPPTPPKSFMLSICITIIFKAHSSPALHLPQNLKALNFLISNKTILACEQSAQTAMVEMEFTEAQAGFGDSKTLRKDGANYSDQWPSFSPTQNAVDACGSWLHLKMRYCFVSTKQSTEKGDRIGSGMWHLLEKPPLRPVSGTGRRK